MSPYEQTKICHWLCGSHDKSKICLLLCEPSEWWVGMSMLCVAANMVVVICALSMALCCVGNQLEDFGYVFNPGVFPAMEFLVTAALLLCGILGVLGWVSFCHACLIKMETRS